MLPRFPRPAASPARRALPSLRIASRRRTAAGAVSFVVLAVALLDAVAVAPVDAATRRTVRSVNRRTAAPTTTAPRVTTTLVPATVQVTPFPAPGAPAAEPTTVVTNLITLTGPVGTSATGPTASPRTDPPGFVPLPPAGTGASAAAPALAPEPIALLPATTTTRPPTTRATATRRSRSARGTRATTTTPSTAPFVPLVAGDRNAAATVRVTPLTASGTTPPGAATAPATSPAPASAPGVLTIAPVLGAAGGQSRTLAAAAPSTTGPVGAGDQATTTATTKPTYVFAQPTEPPPPVHPMAGAVVEAARALLGLPYIWGGEGPDGYDCSGLILTAWRAAGISLIHNSGAQFNQTARVALADIQPGDILFFGNPIHHDALYIGDGKMIEAAKAGVPIRISSINRSDLVGIGRPRW